MRRGPAARERVLRVLAFPAKYPPTYPPNPHPPTQTLHTSSHGRRHHHQRRRQKSKGPLPLISGPIMRMKY